MAGWLGTVGDDTPASRCCHHAQARIAFKYLCCGGKMKFRTTNSGTILIALYVVLAASALPVQAQSFDRQTQMGPDPVLPEPNSYLIPPMKVAKPVDWHNGEVPTVPAGFKIDAIGTGLAHPRQPYV